MNRLKIGIRLESLALPLRRALAEASRLGVSGVQVDAAGDLSPTALSQTGRRAFRHLLRGRILHTHAGDWRRSGPSPAAREVPLGHGDLDWVRYLGVLGEVQYRGRLAVERRTGDSRLADVAEGVAFLRRLVG